MMEKTFTIGCDEVGTGSLAGPLLVCAVRAPQNWSLPGLNDSKKLSAKKRGALLLPLMKLADEKVLSYHLAERSSTQIDEAGMYVTLKSAYVECFRALYLPDSLIIVDGNLKFDNLGADAYDKVSVVKADAKYPTVMAASIIAKEYRDDKMHRLHFEHPEYDWLHNVGYRSKVHLVALQKYGPSHLHRFSYAPIKNLKTKGE